MTKVIYNLNEVFNQVLLFRAITVRSDLVLNIQVTDFKRR
jgi:hypothetical protein